MSKQQPPRAISRPSAILIAICTAGLVSLAVHAQPVVTGGGVRGTGTAGRVMKWTASTTAGDSIIRDDGTNVGIDTAPASKLHVKAGTSTVGAAPAGTVLQLEQADGVANYLTMRGTSVSALLFGSSSSPSDGQVSYNTISRALGLYAAAAARFAMASTGALTAGDTATTSVDNNVDVLSVGNTGTGITGSNDLIDLSHTGTFNTTGGVITNAGVRILNSGDHATGTTNPLTNIGIRSESSGVSTYNYGGYFTAIGQTSGGGCPGGGCTIGGNIPVAYGVYATATGGDVNWAGWFEDGSVYMKNPLNVGTTSGGGAINAEISYTGLAGDTYGVTSGANSTITLDATATPRVNYSLYSIADATRSAGANNVANYGIYAEATGGQENYSGFFGSGDFLVTGPATFTTEATVARLNGTRITGSLTASTNNWAPSGYNTATVVDITSTTGSYNLTGFDSTDSDTGRILVINNRSGNSVVLLHQSASSSAANRFNLTQNASQTMGDAQSSAGFMWVSGTGWQMLWFHSRYTNSLYDLGNATVAGTFTAPGNVAIGDNVADAHTITGGVTYTGGTWTHNGNLTVGSGNVITLGSRTDLTNNSHFQASGTDPAVSSCGTSPSIIGSDTAGTVTIGTGGTATACTITFATGFTTNAPACVITSQMSTAIGLYISASSTSAFTVTNANPPSAFPASGKFNYFCVGVP
jgi:hypothetical protein